MKTTAALILALASTGAWADLTVRMNLVDEKGAGESAGTIKASDSKHGLVLTPDLQGLEPGLHGFHVHQNPSCDPQEKDGKVQAALAAGGHLDPKGTNRHDAPWGDGHLGDLPPLYVDNDGKADQPVLAPRLKVADLKGRSLMVHAGGDNHADHPKPLGGGGARVACGVIE
jgi:superoxide dismutase, Cu-Zn family